MVLAEKSTNNDGGPRNGRRSRGPSPNGLHQQQADSTSEDESSVPVDKIRVGRDYQAVCPELQPASLRKPELIADRALLVWSPTADIAESKLEDYIVLAKDKYGYNGEQALGMLFWHKHDLERAVLDLANFTPFPDEWSVEDKVLFEQAFQFHGKSFHRIRQMLPDKSIASLVKYYYGWKKTRSRTSLMDKQARKLQSSAGAAGKSAQGGNTGTDDNAQQTGASVVGDHNNTSEPNSGNEDSDHEVTNKNTSYSGGKVPIQPKQTLTLKRKHSDMNDDIRTANYRTACRWTHEEVTLVVEGVRKHGKDFKAIADAVGGNKNEQHVRAFYINNRKKYGLDVIMREWEREHNNTSNNTNTSLSGNSVSIGGIASAGSNNGKSKSNSRPIMARDNNNSGLLIEQTKQQQQSLTPTIIDIDDDDDEDMAQDNDNISDNASDVICISPSPPPSQPLASAPSANVSITATTNTTPKQQQSSSQSNGKMAIATSTVNTSAVVAQAPPNTALVVGAQPLK